MTNNVLQSNKGSVKSEDREAFNLSERAYNSMLLVPKIQEKMLVSRRRRCSKFTRKSRNNARSIISKRNTISKRGVVIASRSILRDRSESNSLYSSNSPRLDFNHSATYMLVKDNRIRISSQTYKKLNDTTRVPRMVTMRDIMAQEEAK